MDDLFGESDNAAQLDGAYQPLAALMRPTSIDEYVGQEHILGIDKPLLRSIQSGTLHSMIFWGPPGVGKTTLAKLLATASDANFMSLSAVMSGVKDIRAAVEQARQIKAQSGRATILFVDEVHRFNKSQQDGFLPHIEDGTFIFVGATTENPSFELNNALLSRCKVYVLKPLASDALNTIATTALDKLEALELTEQQRQKVVRAADGDARRLLNVLEMASDLTGSNHQLDDSDLDLLLSDGTRRFDKGGDQFYDQISALHKSVRGSQPDAAIYWFSRMIDGGCDPIYVARRVVRMASEDIGNADPRALDIAMSAWQVYERLGSPEGELAIAQAVIYLACAPKSNAVYKAYNAVNADIKNDPSYEVPKHLRNAPTELMKDEGHGDGYRYAHDEPEQYAAGEQYFPEEIMGRNYYFPVEQGLEVKIKKKLEYFSELDKKAIPGKPE